MVEYLGGHVRLGAGMCAGRGARALKGLQRVLEETVRTSMVTGARNENNYCGMRHDWLLDINRTGHTINKTMR